MRLLRSLLLAAVLALAPHSFGSTVAVDDQDAAPRFAVVGVKAALSPAVPVVRGRCHLLPAGKGGHAEWRPGQALGEVDVYAHWLAADGHTPDARYEVIAADGTKTIAVNQTLTAAQGTKGALPRGARAGSGWLRLGRFRFDAKSVVRLHASPKGIVAADAILLTDEGRLFDEMGANWSVTGRWIAQTNGTQHHPALSPGYAHDLYSRSAGILTPKLAGLHEVWVSWGAHQLHAPEAIYTLHHRGGTATARIDQRRLADQTTAATGGSGAEWSGFRSLGVYALDAASRLVVTSGPARGALSLDIVRLTPAAEADRLAWAKKLEDQRRAEAERRARETREAGQLLAAVCPADRLLFVKRHAFRPSHIYTEYSDGPYRPGGGLYTLSPVRPDGKVARLFDAKGGICRDPEVSFDASRILFSYRVSADGTYHIFEMNADGSGLRQVTRGPFHDMDPLYLPDGRIAFTSTRCLSRVLCFWPQAATLFVMSTDGSAIQPLTANNVNEFTPDLLPDGRIVYTRWEYMDKSAIYIQSLWSTNPDGTRAQQVFGNNLIHPVSLLQARLIPGSRRFACILAAHNGDSVGPLAVVDPTQGMNNYDAILNLTPECNYHAGAFAPYPLSPEWCLVSYGPSEPFGLTLFHLAPPADAITPRKWREGQPTSQHPGNLRDYFRSATSRRLPLLRDPVFSCVEAVPMLPRIPPPRVASGLRDEEQQAATLVLLDVAHGLGGAVPRGTVKYLRIVEEMGHREFSKPRGIGGFMNYYASPWENGKPAPSLQAKHVYGTVPVEPDGSAHFTVPPNRALYFQALDAQHNEVQRMRSYIHLKPGERQSCIGCHEPRNAAPAAGREAAALRRPPSAIQPPPWGAGPFAYEKLVQPILSLHCAACHATAKPAGGVNLAATRDARGVPASFRSLVRPRPKTGKPLVHFFDSWWGVHWTVPVARPLTFGARVSRLMEMIDTQHRGVAMSDADRARIRLSPVERRAITTWIDLNCPLWDNYSPTLHARR